MDAETRYVEHRHRLWVTEQRDGSERWYIACSCGEVKTLGPFDTEGEARRRLSAHALDGQYSYRV